MTAPEQGLLLLCCRLEDDALPLTMGQYRKLRQMVNLHRPARLDDRDLTEEDLVAVGCSEEESRRILDLLNRRESLLQSQKRWNQQGIEILTRLNPLYPQELRERLGDDAPPVLFLRGDAELLCREKIALVGSRELLPQSAAFTALAGRMAAKSGKVLVSGNARGADQTAQNACLEAGGSVISFVADQLSAHPSRKNVLFISEEVPERGFSTGRALRRNRLIHAVAQCTIAVQPRNGIGGTWSGAVHNLQNRWSPLYVYDDGSTGTESLKDMGAVGISSEELQKLF